MTTQSSPPKNAKGFEEALWDAANKLRGSVESSEYKHVVLSLIFLKFVSDKFEARRAELVDEGKQAYLDMVEFYTMKNVFYLPEEARWSHLLQYAKQRDLAIRIDSALALVEKNNTTLNGALPDNYFSGLNLDASKLAALLDAFRSSEERNAGNGTGRNLARYQYFFVLDRTRVREKEEKAHYNYLLECKYFRGMMGSSGLVEVHMTRHDTTGHYRTRHDTTRHDTTRHDTTRLVQLL